MEYISLKTDMKYLQRKINVKLMIINITCNNVEKSTNVRNSDHAIPVSHCMCGSGSNYV